MYFNIIFVLFLIGKFELSDNQASDFKAKNLCWFTQFGSYTMFAKLISLQCLA